MHQRRAQWHGVQLSDTYSCPIHQSALPQSRNNHTRYIISTVTYNYNTSKHWECIDVNIFLVHKQMFADITSINMERKKKKRMAFYTQQTYVKNMLTIWKLCRLLLLWNSSLLHPNILNWSNSAIIYMVIQIQAYLRGTNPSPFQHIRCKKSGVQCNSENKQQVVTISKIFTV